VSLVAYAVGGAFLDLAYYDLPYNIMIIVVLTYAWVRRRAWETEPVAQPGRWRIPGLAGPAPTVAR
jgi:putative inorganic carbon (hco3(-)) transporter